MRSYLPRFQVRSRLTAGCGAYRCGEMRGEMCFRTVGMSFSVRMSANPSLPRDLTMHGGVVGGVAKKDLAISGCPVPGDTVCALTPQ